MRYHNPKAATTETTSMASRRPTRFLVTVMVRLMSKAGQGVNRVVDKFFAGPAWGLWKSRKHIPKKLRFPPLSCVSEARYNDAVPFPIRQSQAEDFDRLWQIDQECFPPGISYSRQELRAYMRRRGSFTLVATDDSAAQKDQRSAEIGEDPRDRSASIAGFIVAYGGATGHIITIDVIEPARRSGLGSQLLAAAEDRLRSTGSRAVGLETAVDNAAAISFYKRHGYSVVGTWPRYYTNGVDALMFKKDL